MPSPYAHLATQIQPPNSKTGDIVDAMISTLVALGDASQIDDWSPGDTSPRRRVLAHLLSLNCDNLFVDELRRRWSAQ